MGKLSLGLGLGVGYVLGTQAGRARYEQIKQAAMGLMERPEVQQALEKAQAAAPAPLQGALGKLSQQGSAPQPAGGSSADVDETILEQVGGGTPSPWPSDAALPDPLIPPARSTDDST